MNEISRFIFGSVNSYDAILVLPVAPINVIRRFLGALLNTNHTDLQYFIYDGDLSNLTGCKARHHDRIFLLSTMW
jgi:hypothetical protein